MNERMNEPTNERTKRVWMCLCLTQMEIYTFRIMHYMWLKCFLAIKWKIFINMSVSVGKIASILRYARAKCESSF